MKIRLLAAALAFCTGLTLSACNKPAEGYTSAQGSVGASQDDALVFAADTDTDQLYVFDTTTEQRIAAVAVGPSPEKVLVGSDDTIYVTNRMGRSISVIRRGDWKEAARIDVGVEPVSMALTGDGKTLYVVSSTSLQSADFGVLTAIDTGTLSAKWELPVGHEPRGIALVEGNRAVISLFKDGDVALVDLSGPTMLRNSTDLFGKLNTVTLQNGSVNGGATDVGSPRPLPPESPNGFIDSPRTSRARGIESLVVSPDGRQVFAAAHLSSDAVLSAGTTVCTDGLNCAQTPDQFPGGSSGGGGSGYGGGSCGATAVSSPALLTFDSMANPVVDDIINCNPQNTDRPPMLLNSGNSTIPIQGPRAAVVDSSGEFVFVVNHDSNNVAIVGTSTQVAQQNGGISTLEAKGGGFGGSFGLGSVKNVVSVGAGPTGIALAKDGKRAWVYNSFDHSLSRIESTNGVLRTVKTVELGKDVLSADVVIGRKLFFSTTDSRMNNLGTGISCGTCHLDGREDGHVWNFTTGPRQTPTLAGRQLEKTEPLHWDGEFKNMGDLSHAITGRMGGSGITAVMAKQISAFLASMPAADNPHRLAEKTPAQLRGAQVFTKANCQSCHAGALLTDNSFAKVGTFVLSGNVRDDLSRMPNGLNTPSLLGLARSAPYLHDGSATTLKARILQGKENDLHGATSKLSATEVDDLVAYLQTL
jgi:YVTN family beta-propeller protein